MLNFVENLLENERDPRSGPMNDQDHSLSLSDPDRSLVLSHFLTNFLQNLASCHTAFIPQTPCMYLIFFLWQNVCLSKDSSTAIDFSDNQTSGFDKNGTFMLFLFTVTSAKKNTFRNVSLWKMNALVRIQGLLILVQVGLVVLNIPILQLLGI
jgi:hypothetical protein